MVGSPVDLGDGDRMLRHRLRSLTPKDLVGVLADGQGLPDLQDMDGVLASVPGLSLVGVHCG